VHRGTDEELRKDARLRYVYAISPLFQLLIDSFVYSYYIYNMSMKYGEVFYGYCKYLLSPVCAVQFFLHWVCFTVVLTKDEVNDDDDDFSAV